MWQKYSCHQCLHIQKLFFGNVPILAFQDCPDKLRLGPSIFAHDHFAKADGTFQIRIVRTTLILIFFAYLVEIKIKDTFYISVFELWVGADEWRMTNALSNYRPQKQPISPRQNEIRLLKIKRENSEMINISQEDVDFIMQEIQKIKLQKISKIF